MQGRLPVLQYRHSSWGKSDLMNPDRPTSRSAKRARVDDHVMQTCPLSRRCVGACWRARTRTTKICLSTICVPNSSFHGRRGTRFGLAYTMTVRPALGSEYPAVIFPLSL